MEEKKEKPVEEKEEATEENEEATEEATEEVKEEPVEEQETTPEEEPKETRVEETKENNAQGSKEVSSENKKKSTVTLICAIVIVICLLAIVMIIFLNGKKKTEVAEKTVKKSEYRMSGNDLSDFDLYFMQLEKEEQNKIYSPLSIKYALAMLKEGSDGATCKQIENVIGDYQPKKYDNNEHMSFANAMFIRNEFKRDVKKDYVSALQNKYSAEVIYDSFKSAEPINSWVSNKTFHLVENLLDDETVTEGDFFLVNALAIDMNWVNRIQCSAAPLPEGMDQRSYHVYYPHEEYSASIGIIMDEDYPSMTFNNQEEIKSVQVGASFNRYDIVKELGEDNIRKTVTEKYQEYVDENGPSCGEVEDYVNQYMEDIDRSYHDANFNNQTSTDFSIYTDDDVKVFAKDLQEYNGTTLQYVAIMPKEESLGSYVDTINASKVNSLVKKLKEVKYDNFKEGVVTKVQGSIPLYEFSYEMDLIKDLQTLGMKDAFDINKADLSKMVETKEAINKVIHKAKIEFSNDGIKAAAATTAGGMGSAGCGFDYKYEVPVEEIDVTFDKPFLFLIRDKKTGKVWFAGNVYNPTKNEKNFQ